MKTALIVIISIAFITVSAILFGILKREREEYGKLIMPAFDFMCYIAIILVFSLCLYSIIAKL